VSLAQKTISGAAWSIATSLGSRALGLVGTLLLVRFLLPDEYGEVSAAAIVVATANQISTLGVGMYVIANPKAPREVVWHATAIHIMLGLLAVGAVIALRGPLGPVFDAPAMGRFVPGLALAMLMDRIYFIPERVLLRELRFPLVGVSRSLGEIAYTVVSVVFAWRGLGATAVVLGNLARSAIRLLIVVAAAPRREWLEPAPLRKKVVRELSGYGVTVSVAGFAGFAARRWDNLLVSRMFGAGIMGEYNLAYNLADVPAVHVGEQVTDVLLSSFARLEPGKHGRALLRSTGLIALIMFPLAAGLAVISPTLVATFFNNKWASVAPMLMILSVLSVPRPVAGAVGAYLQALNRPRVVAILEVGHLALLMASLATIGRLGPLWACGAVGATFIVRALANLWAVQVLDKLPMRDFLWRMVGPLLACAPMVAAVLAVRAGLAPMGLKHWVQLLLELITGIVVYAGSALVLARQTSRELLGLARRALAPG
jgi:PST family polysaccharide transporter